MGTVILHVVHVVYVVECEHGWCHGVGGSSGKNLGGTRQGGTTTRMYKSDKDTMAAGVPIIR